MGRVSTYLNFDGQSEEALTFYANIFGVEAPRVMRFGDMPAGPDGGESQIPEADRNKAMHAEIRILDDYRINASDVIEAFGQKLTVGTNVYISIDPETREDADRIYAALAEGGNASMPLEEQFWGDYFGELTDKFGVQWMFNCTAGK